MAFYNVFLKGKPIIPIYDFCSYEIPINTVTASAYPSMNPLVLSMGSIQMQISFKLYFLLNFASSGSLIVPIAS